MAADSATVSTGLANAPATSANCGAARDSAAAAAADRHRRRRGGRRHGGAVVAGPDLQPAVRQPVAEDEAQVVQALRRGADPLQARRQQRRHQVPAERVHEARLKLAGQGLPQGNDSFAPVSKDSGLRRQPVHGERALPARAGERAGAHHLSLQAVEAARVSPGRCRSSRRSCSDADRRAPRCSCS